MAPAANQTTQMSRHVSIGSGCRKLALEDLFDDAFQPSAADVALPPWSWPQGFRGVCSLDQLRCRNPESVKPPGGSATLAFASLVRKALDGWAQDVARLRKAAGWVLHPEHLAMSTLLA